MIDLQRREIITPCRTPVDDHDRLLILRLMPHETQSRHHGQGRSQDYQDICGFHERVRRIDSSLGHCFPKEHDIGFQSAATLHTTSQPELPPVLRHRIAIRTQFGML